ncbi:conserved hypothetical protein [Desulfamplus magnetovallimortis]|uniref:DUF1257 domain-containing protein n=1 Tax=Desulfamplus magnetovallimortis TaxID=1246637 RepID=A0A1W1HEK9_9BACT|nr:DUF1257 domain-containing protein [Desulfamplus magnetovallimortis]SLM30863.1 conserved hypothetical protein [Desulfamplus magnetovallimortis]
MSHIAKIELEVTDIESLSKACQRMGLTLVQGKTSYKWYYGDNKCDHAIIIPGADYEIGLVLKDGKYELETDFYDQGIRVAIGQNGGLLKQRYAVERTKAEAIRKGYRVIEKQTENNAIRLHVRM